MLKHGGTDTFLKVSNFGGIGHFGLKNFWGIWHFSKKHFRGIGYSVVILLIFRYF